MRKLHPSKPDRPAASQLIEIFKISYSLAGRLNPFENPFLDYTIKHGTICDVCIILFTSIS